MVFGSAHTTVAPAQPLLSQNVTISKKFVVLVPVCSVSIFLVADTLLLPFIRLQYSRLHLLPYYACVKSPPHSGFPNPPLIEARTPAFPPHHYPIAMQNCHCALYIKPYYFQTLPPPPTTLSHPSPLSPSLVLHRLPSVSPTLPYPTVIMKAIVTAKARRP